MSERSLDQLINTLKSEAIEAADKQALEILETAQNQARMLIEAAKENSERLVQNAKEEAQGIRKKGESALQQAARDLSISVRYDVLKLLGKVLESEVETAFSPHLIEAVILKVAENVGSGSILKLPSDLEEHLALGIQKRLQTSGPITSIIKDTGLLKGFSIANTDKGWSYTISPEAVSELLYERITPKWIQILENKSDI